MLIGEAFAERREQVRQSPDLGRLLARLVARAGPVLEREPIVPSAKALLSVDGGVCPRDGGPLVFDPWSPDAHRCARCGERVGGERQHRWWARFQHLWLAERAAHLAAVAAFGGTAQAAERAAAILRAYADRYLEYPNSDNVLGPSRPFFSTYLESIWITNLVAAAVMLREANALDDRAGRAMDEIGEEAAGLIGEFNEGLSNRQTWHNAALAALAVWFEDEELLAGSLGGPAGLLAHALQGFGADGMWYEGENYHLFALRGLLVGLDWVRAADLDPRGEAEVAERVRAALLAPALTALPDATFPARKDARFGMSLAQPMYLELWEAGRGAGGPAGGALDDWLATLYAVPAPAAGTFDSYLHETGEPRARAALTRGSVLVDAREHAAGARRPGPPLAAGRRADALAGAGSASEPRAVRQPGVRAVWRRTRPPRSAPSHHARGRGALAARPRNGELRGAGPLLVPLHARAQRAPARWHVPGRRGCSV